jgi:hypothetical protein
VFKWTTIRRGFSARDNPSAFEAYLARAVRALRSAHLQHFASDRLARSWTGRGQQPPDDCVPSPARVLNQAVTCAQRMDNGQTGTQTESSSVSCLPTTHSECPATARLSPVLELNHSIRRVWIGSIDAARRAGNAAAASATIASSNITPKYRGTSRK